MHRTTHSAQSQPKRVTLYHSSDCQGGVLLLIPVQRRVYVEIISSKSPFFRGHSCIKLTVRSTRKTQTLPASSIHTHPSHPTPHPHRRKPKDEVLRHHLHRRHPYGSGIRCPSRRYDLVSQAYLIELALTRVRERLTAPGGALPCPIKRADVKVNGHGVADCF
jgi:hypothetical protein